MNEEKLGESADGQAIFLSDYDQKLKQIREEQKKASSVFDFLRRDKEGDQTMESKQQSQMPPTAVERELALQDVEIPEIVEIRDNEHIIQAVRGAALEEAIYDFLDSRKNRVLGLSFSGVKLAVQQMGGLTFDFADVLVDETKDYIRVNIKIHDTKRNLDSLGVCQQRKFYQSGNPVEFAWTLAHNKALRNAWRHLIPENVIKHIINEYVKSAKYKQRTELHQKQGMNR